MDQMVTASTITTEDEANFLSNDPEEIRTLNGSPVNDQADIRNERRANGGTDELSISLANIHAQKEILMKQLELGAALQTRYMEMYETERTRQHTERIKEIEANETERTRQHTERIKKIEANTEAFREITKQIEAAKGIGQQELLRVKEMTENVMQFGKEIDSGRNLTLVGSATPSIAASGIAVGIALSLPPVALAAGAVGACVFAASSMGVGMHSIASGTKNRDEMVKQIESLNSAYLDRQSAINEALTFTTQAAGISGQDSNSN